MKKCSESKNIINIDIFQCIGFKLLEFHVIAFVSSYKIIPTRISFRYTFFFKLSIIANKMSVYNSIVSACAYN